ncbi:hypothetical protein GCM10020367_71700 [Streptomyces sannanensis]|uniref:Uncharacterized protein n=1 Tax=Streptomyces sannanensis TaxID=285536 RepID=A0ABP6SNY1_9ACTN
MSTTNATGTEPEPHEPEDSGESGEAGEETERHSRADRFKRLGSEAATVVAMGFVAAIGDEVVRQILEWLSSRF